MKRRFRRAATLTWAVVVCVLIEAGASIGVVIGPIVYGIQIGLKRFDKHVDDLYDALDEKDRRTKLKTTERGSIFKRDLKSTWTRDDK